MEQREPNEVLLWSIALPGFGQLLNGHVVKGILFIALEFLVNVNAHLNLNIKYSFQGQFERAVHVTSYEWAMFYPCLYVFAMLDAYIQATKNKEKAVPPLLGIPYATAAFLSTIGVIYSDVPSLYRWVTPTFVPIVAMIIGFVIGEVIRRFLNRKICIPKDL